MLLGDLLHISVYLVDNRFGLYTVQSLSFEPSRSKTGLVLVQSITLR